MSPAPQRPEEPPAGSSSPEGQTVAESALQSGDPEDVDFRDQLERARRVFALERDVADARRQLAEANLKITEAQLALAEKELADLKAENEQLRLEIEALRGG
jgi:hypothetical protein